MSQFTISILTGLTMLCHSIVGCCWHHVSAECEPSAPLVTQKIANQHICTHHHSTGLPGSSDEKPAPSHENHSCDGQTCVYVKSSTPEMTHLFDAPFATTVTMDSVADRVERDARLWLGRSHGIPDPLTSRSRCALTQSWQI